MKKRAFYDTIGHQVYINTVRYGMRSFMFFLLLVCLPFKALASSSEESNPLMDHVKDSHSWHFATIGHQHLTLYLPVILYKKGYGFDVFLSSCFYNSNHERVAYSGYKIDSKEKIRAIDGSKVYDLSITKVVISVFFSAILLLLIGFLAAYNYRKNSASKVPKGWRVLLEMLVIFIRDEIAIPNIGKYNYRHFMSYLITVFCFIFLNNLLGLLPGAANVTGNISITFSLSLCTLILTIANGNKNYWSHLLLPPVPKWLYPIMVPIELLGVLTKPFSLMIRLFANITAGHIILLSIIFIIFILKKIWAPLISVPFGVFMFLLKLIVSFLQAYVFTLLSAIYFGSAVEEEH